MRILDFLQHSVSPEMRCGACAILGGALLLLYRWDPERRTEEQEREQPCGEILGDHPVGRSPLTTLSGDGVGQSETGDKTHPTLIELENYLADLKRHQIHSLDHV